MKTKRIEFEGITKDELHRKITGLLDKYDNQVKENNISVVKNGDVYSIAGSIKKFIFTFSIKADVELYEGYILVHYDTDIPESYHNEGIESFRAEIKSA